MGRVSCMLFSIVIEGYSLKCPKDNLYINKWRVDRDTNAGMKRSCFEDTDYKYWT